MAAHTQYHPALGICCICRMKHPNVRNIVMLNLKAPVPGKGWGCVVCGLPSDGAIAVLCDDCLEAYNERDEKLKLVCAGYAGANRRVPLSSLTVPFQHDMSKHPAEQ